MKNLLVFCIVFIFSLALLGFADAQIKYELDGKVTELSLKDLDGNEFNLEKVLAQDDVKGVVFVFMSYQCPGSIAYDARYVEYATEFGKKGIKFVGVSSNFNDPVEAYKDYAAKKSYNFPVLKDMDNVIADRFSATVTPHAFLIDKKGVLCYKGAIDDNQKPELVKNKVLSGVIDEILSGKKNFIRVTREFG